MVGIQPNGFGLTLPSRDARFPARHAFGPQWSRQSFTSGRDRYSHARETAVENTIAPHCVLIIHYNGHDYLGSLSFDDEDFLKTVCEVLKSHTGASISAIGSLDIA